MRRTLAALTGAALAVLALVPGAAGAATSGRGCDALDPRACLLPWPSDHFTVKSTRTDTGRRLRLPTAGAPRNAKGVRADLAPYATSDGFSPGGPIMAHVPGLDLRRTRAVPITDLRTALDPGQPVVVIDARTRKRQLVWAELDAGAPSAKERLLLIHPAANLPTGRRYIVALRNLKDRRGRLLKPDRAFRALRDRTRAPSRDVAARRRHFEGIFRTLERAKIKRSSLYLAWDFTVAGERNLTERALAIRDNAFARLGDSNLLDRKVAGRAPAFAIDAVRDFAPCGGDGCQEGENDNLARTVTGTMTVPCYLDKPGCPPGSRFRFKKRKKGRFTFIPERVKDNTMRAPFVCVVPRVALAAPARASLYGHGLLGTPEEVTAGNVQQMAQEHNFVFCATREIGMADEDIPNAIRILGEVGRFPSLADRLQQGLLNGLLLGRLMIHPQGLASSPAFKTPAGAPVIDTSSLFYDSNSQGGIFGGALTALAPDFQRAVLGVPGMRYSLLLPRSVDFDAYEAFFVPAYKSRLERMLIIGMLQTLWDRGEASGYAANMTGNPLPNTPLHSVLLHVALGDHQVAQVSAEIEARTIRAVVRQPVFDPGRYREKIPWYEVTPAGDLELGSVAVVWDSGPTRDGGALGTDVPPLAGVPPRAGNDPHELVRRTAAARRQKSEFLREVGRFVDVCPRARACRVDGWPY